MNPMTADITITSLETISAFDIITGNFLFTLDELQNATLSQTQDTTDITGKQGRRLNTLKRNKAVTISGDNGLVSAGLLEMQTGGKFANDVETNVMWTDYISVTSNKSATTFKAVGTTGAEISNLYVKNADGTLGEKLEQADAAADGKFKYDPSNNEIDLEGNELADGTELVAFYTRKIKGTVLENNSDVYSEKCTLYVDAIGEDTCGAQYRIQVYIPKADFDGNWDMEILAEFYI